MNAKVRTQSSIAVSENGVDWILLNASPDIRQQLLTLKQLNLRVNYVTRALPTLF